MQRADPLRELGGWLVLAALFALFLLWYVRRWQARKQRFWAPLAQIVDGRGRGYRMVGTYEGHEVVAEIGPVPEPGPRSPNDSAWYFMTAIDCLPGRNARQRRRTFFEPAGVDWEVRYGGEGGPEFSTGNERVRPELERAEWLAEVQQWETYPAIAYSARSKLISITEDFPDQMTSERFRSRLALLVRLAQVNGELLSRR